MAISSWAGSYFGIVSVRYAHGKGKSTTRGELASSNESVRRESVVAKEKQIDGLVEEAKSFENDLKKVEEEDISEDQIEKRMKELEQS